MDILNILKKVGTSIIKEVVPGGGLVIDLVNTFLPKGKQLPSTATGAQAQDAIASLPPDKRALVLAKELDVEIEEIRGWSAVQASLSAADRAGASTRPFIAKLMAVAVFGAVSVYTLMWGYAVVVKDAAMVKELCGSWPTMLAVLATPTALLRAYFGMRSKEKKARYSAATGQAPASLLSTVVGLFKQ